MHANPLQSLTAFGQSVWVDFLSRELLNSGEFARLLREDGVTGVTTNPSIFEKAVSGSDIYDQRIMSLSGSGLTATEIVRSLNTADVIAAADLLKPVYQHSGGQDGFVSIEVSPHHANNPSATLRAARRLWKAIDRPNLLIKIPATRTCLPAIRQLLVEGININVTLLFGVGRYEEVAEIYLQAMEDRHAAGLPLDKVTSVASFFVSRIDSMLDPMLAQRAAGDKSGAATVDALRGKGAIACAKLVYLQSRKAFSSPRFRTLSEHGAREQRLVWASTSTKNPSYPDTKYIDPLIGAGTITTMPPETLDAYRNHGVPDTTLPLGTSEAAITLRELQRHGIDMQHVAERLESEGLQKFAAAYDNLVKMVEHRSRNRAMDEHHVGLGGNVPTDQQLPHH